MTEDKFIPAKFGDGTVCNTKEALHAYLIGIEMFEPIAHGSEIDTQICFAVGELSRDRLEDCAADVGVEFNKWTTSDDLRAMVIEQAREQRGLVVVNDEGKTTTFGFGVEAALVDQDQSRPRG